MVNIHDAKTQLSRMEQGERITIARADKPVAQLGPAAKAKRRVSALDDSLLRVDEYSVDDPVGTVTNEDIDRIVYGF